MRGDASLRPPRTGSRNGAVPVVLLLAGPAAVAAALAATGLAGGLEAADLADPGALTRWGLPVVRTVAVVAGATTVGLLVLATTVLPAPAATGGATGPSRTGLAELGTTRSAATWTASLSAAVWATATALTAVLTYSDLAGVPLSRWAAPDFGPGLVSFLLDLDTGRALAVSTAAAAAAGVLAGLATRLSTAAAAAVLAVAALVPPAFTGHAAGAANHEAAVDTLVVHVVALSTWAGGLVALVLVRRRLGTDLHVVVARFSRVALWCYVLVGVSGLLGAGVRFSSPADVVSGYGALLGLKLLALVVLGVAGAMQRRWTVERLARSSCEHGPFWWLVVGELAVLALASGLGVALARTPPPVSAQPGAAAPVPDLTTELLGYPMPPALDAARWFDTWRIDTVWAPVAVVALGLYLAGVVRLHRRGDRWPWHRTGLWVLGWAALVWSTSGAPKVYGRVLFSMHMVEHMTIGTLVPILLVLGAPITLLLRAAVARRDGSRGLREWTLVLVHSRVFAVLAHPVVAPVVFVASLIAFYYSPALELSLRTHGGHVLMTAHFILAGYLFAWVICGPDPGPRRPAYPIRLLVLIATMAFHAFFGIAIMSSVEVLAEDWFASLDRPWGPSLIEDQQRGGAMAWGLGDYPVALLAVAMAAAWIRDDARETRRYDRRADRDDDAELAAWNEMLRQRRRLQERARRDGEG